MSLTDLTRNAFQSGLPPAKASVQDVVYLQNPYQTSNFISGLVYARCFFGAGKRHTLSH
jgi:hypothetical protein